ncbi:MAG: hypothetical protein QOE14_1069, partial [Humisphaera sp.]|nr:hypothetical protein [Humisphaera sp.]
QELAAAFQLDFTPSDGSPGAAGESDRRSPRGKTSRKRVAFVFLLLLAGGAAVLMYVRPDLREKATAWSDKTYASVKQFITARTAPAAKPTITPDALPATRPSNAVLAQSPKPPTPAPALTPTTMPARREPIVIAPTPPKVGGPKTVVVGDPPIAPPAPAPTPAHARESTKVLDPVGDALNNTASDASITASSKTTNAAAVAVPPPVEIIKVAPAPTSAPAVAKPPPPAKVWTNIAEAEDEARRLWRLAIDAEQNQDFVEAVACYEQIKKLPRDVHPSGLEMRLSLAKKLMK